MSHPHADDPQKRELHNRRNFSFRLNLFFFITFVVFTVLIVRLAILQFVEGPSLKEKESQLGFRETAIPPLRGTIWDASGKTRVAYSTATQSLYFNVEKNYGDPKKAKLTEVQQKNREEAQLLAKQLAEVFNRLGTPSEKPLTQDVIYNELMDLEGKRYFVYVPRLIKTGLTQKEIAYFLEHKPEFKGIDIVEDSVRNYDPNSVAVQTVGYLKKFKGVREDSSYYKEKHEKRNELSTEERYLEYEDVGFDGIELMYQDELRGLNGVKKFPVNVAGRIIGPMELTKPQRGNDLYLTIDKEIQERSETAIMEHLKKLRNSSNRFESAPNARTGFAVAMEVDTGNVVSIASMPDYDTNVWKNGSISPENYRSNQYFMGNGAIREVQAPYEDDKERMKHPSSLVYLGSTMKPLTVLIGLQEGFFGPYYRYTDYGYAEIGRKGYERKIWNSSRRSWGPGMTPAYALEKSSNAFMVDMIGKRLYSMPEKDGKNGLQIWDEYMEAFGLGVKTGSGLPGEIPGLKDYIADAEKYSAQSALASASFGQLGKYTTLQLAQYTATLANHGKRIKPQFISKIVDGEGKVVKTFGREVLNETKFNESYWDVVEQGMLKVGAQGFDDFPYQFYRKTGTSEQDVGGGKRVENAVFIAYAPADKPKLAVAVVVPEGGYGSYGAGPIAREIFDAYDEEYGLDGVPKKKAKTGAAESETAADE
ncbi:penicillin-binding protein 2 [Paenibacillus profundus]|uniref:Penicillin-binding protein 2 n=1 Tax=Paenibacillus profundus TaxID=1173085 RepID=A0ABS8YPJ5_9BACL|nr:MULTISPECIES: penicillin-binding protein 2 [Paenibacillus]MCE5171534.1 penicillin-binding protein 2 [Paenibacillus profundus]